MHSIVDQMATLRAMDAGLNRACEGLRVIEDQMRYRRPMEIFAQRLKEFRHELRRLWTEDEALAALRARDVARDPGTRIEVADEYHRPSSIELLSANFKRTQEALRSIEEHAKQIAPTIAPAVEKLRYVSYELEQAIVRAQANWRDLADVRICVLVDTPSARGDLASCVANLAAAGVDMIQLREKGIDDRHWLERAAIVVKTARDHGVLAIVNDRVDIALAAEADGVHLGQEDLDVAAARRLGGTRLLLGVSTHSLAQAEDAARGGADYLGVGPMYPTPTKEFPSHPGPNLAQDVADRVPLPAYAIGGIRGDNVAALAKTGIHGIAVSHFVLHASSPAGAVAELRRHFPRSSQR